MQKSLLSLALILSILTGFSQTDSTSLWKKGGMTSLNLSQVSLNNWASGGQNSLSSSAFVTVFANYKKSRTTWDNTLDLGYGLIKQGDAAFIKSDDKIDFSSKYGQYAFKHWYYSGLANMKTQFTNGYNYPNDSLVISRFLAPAYITVALGMDYKPKDNFTLFISPLTGKVTVVNDDKLSAAGAFGIEPDQLFRSEFGGFIKMQFKTEVIKNISFLTKLDMFSNYLETPENIDINWESLLAMKINKYISANITTHLIYDDDIDIVVDKNKDGITDAVGPRVQFKEVFGLGFSYKF